MGLVRHRQQLYLQLPLPAGLGQIGACSTTPLPHSPEAVVLPPMCDTGTDQEIGSLLDFEKLGVLGHGSHGIVYKVRHKRTSAIYALKTIRGYSNDHTPLSHQPPSHEIKIISSTSSPFLIKCHGVFEPRVGEQAILMEYMDAGTLDAFLRANGPLSEPTIAHIARQVLHGLKYLHASNIVHLDIKPSNLLVTNDLTVKIADFGISKIISYSNTTHIYSNFCEGTLAYMSPERLDSHTFGSEHVYAGDVWSLGVTLLELYMGHFPFFPRGVKPSWMELVMVTCFGDLLPSLPLEASEEFRSFIKCCLVKEPCKRRTVAELLSHPYVCTHDQD